MGLKGSGGGMGMPGGSGMGMPGGSGGMPGVGGGSMPGGGMQPQPGVRNPVMVGPGGTLHGGKGDTNPLAMMNQQPGRGPQLPASGAPTPPSRPPGLDKPASIQDMEKADEAPYRSALATPPGTGTQPFSPMPPPHTPGTLPTYPMPPSRPPGLGIPTPPSRPPGLGESPPAASATPIPGTSGMNRGAGQRTSRIGDDFLDQPGARGKVAGPGVPSSLGTGSLSNTPGIDLRSYATKVANIESSGGRNVGAPGATHQGPYQLGRGWGGSTGSDGERLATGTKQNYAALTKSLGRNPSEKELYLAHQQGASGAARLLSNPDKPAGSLVPPQNIARNGGDPNAPASAFVNKVNAKFDGSTSSGGFRDSAGKASPVGSSTSGNTDRTRLAETHGGDINRAVDDAMTKQGENALVNRSDLMDYMRTGGHNIDPQKQPWCAAFVGAALEHAGIKSANSNVATSYLNWGKPATGGIQKGDVLVLSKGHQAGEPGGHVGIATGRTNDKGQIEMVAGNTGGIRYGRSAKTSFVDPSSVTARRFDPDNPSGTGGTPSSGTDTVAGDTPKRPEVGDRPTFSAKKSDAQGGSKSAEQQGSGGKTSDALAQLKSKVDIPQGVKPVENILAQQVDQARQSFAQVHANKAATLSELFDSA